MSNGKGQKNPKERARLPLYSLAILVSLTVLPLAWLPGYAQQTQRAKTLGKRLICMCGCNQVLTACNHVGCTTSTAMLKELDRVVARNESDDLTLQSFIQKYGEQALAEPPAKGFNRVAWFIPGVSFLLGLVIVLVVISHWRRPIGPAPHHSEISPELLARARQQADQETEE
ncbi:MAG TPA: cytochrome c-type biogenesis protein CcmH [Candidatus Acidoferrales bacterium]|nr:cytochrome c-type biogenesis protein CcmH [Candidatus Acidoferrales bacterium]